MQRRDARAGRPQQVSAGADCDVGHCVPAAPCAPRGTVLSRECRRAGMAGMGRGNAAAGHFFCTPVAVPRCWERWDAPQTALLIPCRAVSHPVCSGGGGRSGGHSQLPARRRFRVRGRALPRGWPLCKVAGACPLGDGHVLSLPEPGEDTHGALAELLCHSHGAGQRPARRLLQPPLARIGPRGVGFDLL